MRSTVILLTSSLFFSVIVASSAGALDLGAISGKDATTGLKDALSTCDVA